MTKPRFAPETPVRFCEARGSSDCNHDGAISWSWFGKCPKVDGNIHARCNDCHREYCFDPKVEYICGECMIIRPRAEIAFVKPQESDMPGDPLLGFCAWDCFEVYLEGCCSCESSTPCEVHPVRE